MAAAGVAALALFGTAACGGAEQPAAGTGTAPAPAEPIRFAFNWTHDIEWAAFYLAEKNGDFTRDGVDVEFVPGGENTPAVSQQIAAGKVDMGVSSDELQIINANKEAATSSSSPPCTSARPTA